MTLGFSRNRTNRFYELKAHLQGKEGSLNDSGGTLSENGKTKLLSVKKEITIEMKTEKVQPKYVEFFEQAVEILDKFEAECCYLNSTETRWEPTKTVHNALFERLRREETRTAD